MKSDLHLNIKLARQVGFGVLLVFALASIAEAGVDEGVIAYNNGDHATAYSEFTCSRIWK